MIVYFSGKISNSILTFMDQEGVNLENLYELTDLPIEFLRDPSSWIEAEKLELFLLTLDQTYGLKFNESLVTIVGRMGFKLRSWGVLDSVIKMMETPGDIYSQPQRLLSYFVSPEPPIANLEIHEKWVKFDLPIGAEEYPYVCEYLKAAFESLPKYISKNPSTVEWADNTIQISWSADEPTLLDGEALKKSLSPELLQGMIKSLESLQSQLEKKNEELKFKDKEIQRLKIDVQNLLKTPVSRKFIPDFGEATVAEEEIKSSTLAIKNEVAKLGDYISRAQQLVTLLIGRGRLDSQAKTAMRRVGWDQVIQGKLVAVRSIMSVLEELNSQFELTKKDQVPKTKNEQKTLEV